MCLSPKSGFIGQVLILLPGVVSLSVFLKYLGLNIGALCMVSTVSLTFSPVFFSFFETCCVTKASLNPQSSDFSLLSAGLQAYSITVHLYFPPPDGACHSVQVPAIWRLLQFMFVNVLCPVPYTDHLCSLSPVIEAHLHQEQSKATR